MAEGRLPVPLDDRRKDRQPSGRRAHCGQPRDAIFLGLSGGQSLITCVDPDSEVKRLAVRKKDFNFKWLVVLEPPIGLCQIGVLGRQFGLRSGAPLTKIDRSETSWNRSASDRMRGQSGSFRAGFCGCGLTDTAFGGVGH